MGAERREALNNVTMRLAGRQLLPACSRPPQQFHNRSLASLQRVHEWGDSLTVGEIHISAMGDQQADDLDISRTAVSEDHRLEQGGPAEALDVIDVDSGAQQYPDRIDMAIVACRDQGGAAVTIGPLEIGTGGKGQAHDLSVASRAGEQKRVVADVVLRIDVGPSRDEQPRCLDMSALRGGKHRIATTCVAGIHRGAGIEQALQGNEVAARRGVDQ